MFPEQPGRGIQEIKQWCHRAARSRRGWSSSLPTPGPTAPSKEAAVFYTASAPHRSSPDPQLSAKMSVLSVKAGKALKRVRREG